MCLKLKMTNGKVCPKWSSRVFEEDINGLLKRNSDTLLGNITEDQKCFKVFRHAGKLTVYKHLGTYERRRPSSSSLKIKAVWWCDVPSLIYTQIGDRYVSKNRSSWITPHLTFTVNPRGRKVSKRTRLRILPSVFLFSSERWRKQAVSWMLNVSSDGR